MVATNTIKINGVWYQAGDELPSDRSPKVEPIEIPKEEKKYTKTEINRMNNHTLRKVATEIGIEDPEEYTGSELKEMLIEKLGL